MMKSTQWRFWTVLCVVAGLAACEGPMGPAGADGIDGLAGSNGSPGVDGARGMDGIAGSDGADGPPGIDGRDGDAGVNPPVDLLNAGILGWLPENRTALNALIVDGHRNPEEPVTNWPNAG